MLIPLVTFACLALAAPAWAQQGGRSGPGNEEMARPSAPDRLVGKAVQVRGQGRAVGEVAEVVDRHGRSGLVVQIEAQDRRPVLLDADAVEQEGGTLYLAISEAALRDLPTFETASGEPSMLPR